MHIAIRDFQRADFDELWRIDQECFDPGISYSRMELDHYVRRRSAFTLIAVRVSDRKHKRSQEPQGQPADKTGVKQGSNVVGFIVVEQDARGRGHVITIDVRPTARRGGVGTQLMNAAEQRLRAAGCHAVFLETAVNNMTALSFYKRRGYSVFKTIPRYYQKNLDAFLLGKRLEPVVRSQ